MSTRIVRLLSLPALLLLTVAGPAAAGEVSGGGEAAYVTLSEERVELLGGNTLRNYRSAGFVTAKPGNPFHDTEQNCSGTDLIGADDEIVRSAGYCEGSDVEGDVWWIWWRGDAEGGVWGLLDGSGKFAGLTGGGSMRTLKRWPNGKYTIRWEGSWKSQ